LQPSFFLSLSRLPLTSILPPTDRNKFPFPLPSTIGRSDNCPITSQIFISCSSFGFFDKYVFFPFPRLSQPALPPSMRTVLRGPPSSPTTVSSMSTPTSFSPIRLWAVLSRRKLYPSSLVRLAARRRIPGGMSANAVVSAGAPLLPRYLRFLFPAAFHCAALYLLVLLLSVEAWRQ